MHNDAEPFLKWAGGKRWLIIGGQFQTPPKFGRYIEPFLGGGAVFFSLCPKSAILSDINEDLIATYRAVRDFPIELQEMLDHHQRQHSHEHYYKVRASIPADATEASARFIYLNRTCWNGLYRVNRRGEFNVPIGTKTKVKFENDELLRASIALKSVEIYCGDFEKFIDNSEENDFIFVDPPYTANHNLNGFLKYNETIFSWADQLRLRNAVARAASRGAYIVVTNADHQSVRELYEGICSYTSAARASVLSGKREGRKQTTEALFTANL